MTHVREKNFGLIARLVRRLVAAALAPVLVFAAVGACLVASLIVLSATLKILGAAGEKI